MLDPANTCACGGTGDPGLFMWALQWWPHAITNGIDPFWTNTIWYPADNNIPATTSVPALSLALWPVTELADVVVSYNIATGLSAILSAWFAYRLCRYVTGAWLPSLVGGYVFGFSSYELGQSIGHLHLVPIFLVPAAVHLVLLRMDERIGVRRFVVVLAAIFALQVLISTEVIFAGLVFGFTALLVAFWLVPERRPAIRTTVPQVFVAGGLAALVLSPFLYEAFRGLGAQPSLDWHATVRVFSADPLNYVLPTPITWVGGGWTESLANRYNSLSGGVAGAFAESGAYIGLPLLALAGWYAARTWRRAATRFAVVLVGLIFVASLGPQLHVAEAPAPPDHEFREALWLPWAPFAYLPVFDHLLPVRFTLFAFLVVAVLVARALTLPARRAWAPWLVAGAGVVALLPTFSGSRWSGDATVPPFFEDGTYKRYIARDDVLLTFPMQSGDAMFWQAGSDWYFRMASGYISAEVPPAFWRDPVALNLLSVSGSGPISPENLPAAARDFLDRHRVAAVVLDPSRALFWEGVLDRMQLRKHEVGGVLLYRVERSWPYLAWGPEFSTALITAEQSVRWMVRHEATVPIVNPLHSPQVVTLRGLLRGAPTAPGDQVRLDYPDGTSQELSLRPAGTVLGRRLTLAPGVSSLHMVASGPEYYLRPDPRAHYLELRDVALDQ